MIDISFLRKFTKDNPKKMKRYITMYLTEAEKTFAGMQPALAEADWTSLKIQAHSLKPQAELMGAHALKAKLIEVETAVQENQIAALPDLVAEALALHAAATIELQAHIPAD